MPLRLKWSHTWPEKQADFHCHDDAGNPVGRIYRMVSGTLDSHRWFWAANGHIDVGDRTIHLHTHGHAPTKQAAAEAVEAEYFKTLEKLRTSPS